jgi:hypothetical protein
MPTLQNFLQGQHIVTLTIQPVVVSALGVTSAYGASEDLVLSVDQVSLRGSVLTEEIHALTSVRRNEVPYEVATMFTVTEILKRAGASASPNYCQLARIWDQVMLQTYRHAELIWSRGGVGTGNSFDFLALIGSYNDTGRKTKNTGRMSFMQVDFGSANPIYTTA